MMLFEDLLAWQEARVLVKLIYDLTRNPEINRDYRFVDQLRSTTVSIMNNIAEGFERHFIKEKIQFYNISRGSYGELRSLLYVIEDSFIYLLKEVNKCRTQLEKTGKLVTGLTQSTQKRL